MLRRLSRRGLTLLLVLAAGLLLDVALRGERRDLIGGWALDAAGSPYRPGAPMLSVPGGDAV